jgi:hypothetical protein
MGKVFCSTWLHRTPGRVIPLLSGIARPCFTLVELYLNFVQLCERLSIPWFHRL